MNPQEAAAFGVEAERRTKCGGRTVLEGPTGFGDGLEAGDTPRDDVPRL